MDFQDNPQDLYNKITTEKGILSGDIVKAKFTTTDSKTYKCNQCSESIKKGNGPRNLINHLLRRDHIEILKDINKNGIKLKNPNDITYYLNENPRINTFNLNQKDVIFGLNLYNWLLIIVKHNLPFTFADDEIARSFSKYGKTCSDSVSKYILKFQDQVVERIKAELPEHFALVFDGWSENSKIILINILLIIIFNRNTFRCFICCFYN